MDAAAAVKAEQRVPVTGAAAFDLAGQEFADAWPVRNQAALAELAAAHRQELPPGVDVADAKTACFPGAQAQPVAEGEDGVVDRSAPNSPRIVGEGCGGFQQPAGLADVEQERQTHIRLVSPGSAQGRGFQTLLSDGPVEEAADDPDEVVEAAGSCPGPRRDEHLEQGGSELGQALHAVLAGEREQQA